MSANVFKFNFTGTALMAHSATVPAGQHWRIISVSCNFNAAPVSAENFTITLDAQAGPVYDVLLYSTDPSAGAISDILWQPDEELMLEPGDQVDVAYDNTDVRTYGVQITFKAV